MVVTLAPAVAIFTAKSLLPSPSPNVPAVESTVTASVALRSNIPPAVIVVAPVPA